MKIPFLDIEIPWWGAAGILYLFSGGSAGASNTVYNGVNGIVFSDLVSDKFNEINLKIAKALAKNPEDLNEVQNLANWLMVCYRRESNFNPKAHANAYPVFDKEGNPVLNEKGNQVKKWKYGLITDSSINEFTASGGLIGFIQKTAKYLWKLKKIYYTNGLSALHALLDLSAEEQLGFVYLMLEPYKGKIDSLGTLRVLMFKPSAFKEGFTEDTVLYSQKDNPSTYAGNEALDLNEDGLLTVKELQAKAYETLNEGYERLKKKSKGK